MSSLTIRKIQKKHAVLLGDTAHKEMAMFTGRQKSIEKNGIKAFAKIKNVAGNPFK